MSIIHDGVIFDTDHEQCCLALSAPDVNGHFEAFDSDGVRVIYHHTMVTRVYPTAAETMEVEG